MCVGMYRERVCSFRQLPRGISEVHARSQHTALAEFLALISLVGRCSWRLCSKRAHVNCMASWNWPLNSNQHARPALALEIRTYSTWQHQPFTTKVSHHSWPSWFGPANNLRVSQLQIFEKNTYPEGCLSRQKH